MTKLTTTEARETWESAAPGWAKWEDVFAVGFRGATETMLDMANVPERDCWTSHVALEVRPFRQLNAWALRDTLSPATFRQRC